MTAAEKERIEFAERLNKVLDDKGYPMRGRAQKVLAETKLNISDRAINKWLKGESIPDHSNLAILSRHYGVGFDWLATGNGEMIPSIENPKPNIDLPASSPSVVDLITNIKDMESKGELTPQVVSAINGVIEAVKSASPKKQESNQETSSLKIDISSLMDEVARNG